MKTFQLFDDVGFDITLKKVVAFLNANKNSDIEFKIASLGGSLPDAISIFNIIKMHKGKTSAHIIGWTASAGTVLALACDSVKIEKNALFLVHNAIYGKGGNRYELAEIIKLLEKNDKQLVELYKKETGIKEETIISLMKKGDWMTADEALKYGFVNEIVDTNKDIAAHVDKEILNNLTKNRNMGIFDYFKSNKAQIYELVTNDGNLAMNTENVAVDTEVYNLFNNSEEINGDIVLKDGRTVKVQNSIVKEIVNTEGNSGIIESIKGVIAQCIKDSEERMETKFKGMITSNAVPPKSTVNSKEKKEFNIDDFLGEGSAKIRTEINNAITGKEVK